MTSHQETLLKTRRFQVVRIQRIRDDGETAVFDTIQHPGAVAIIPILPHSRVCLIENDRPTVGRRLVELPAGTIDPGEQPIETACRELAEETGYRAAGLESVGEFFMSPGILNERMHVFVATELTAGKQSLDANEDIRTITVSWKEAVAMVIDGRIEDAKSIAGILLYDRIIAARQSDL